MGTSICLFIRTRPTVPAQWERTDGDNNRIRRKGWGGEKKGERSEEEGRTCERAPPTSYIIQSLETSLPSPGFIPI